MKNCFLIIAALLFSLSITAQEKVNVDDLIGYWEPDKDSTQLVFWKNTKNELQVVEFSTTSGILLDLISLKVNTSVIIKTKFTDNDWTTQSEFTFIDKNTLKCVITGDGSGTIIYTKVK